MFPSYTPWKDQKNRGFLIFAGIIEREHWSQWRKKVKGKIPDPGYGIKSLQWHNCFSMFG